MRDLKADLETCDNATPGPWETEYSAGYSVATRDIVICHDLWLKDAEFIAAAREGWPHAIERAIKAEAKFTECRKAAEVLQSEVERLRKIIGDAREWMLPNTEAWKITCELDKESER